MGIFKEFDLKFWIQFFNLIFRRKKFISSGANKVWKNPEIQKIYAERWSMLYASTLKQIYYIAMAEEDNPNREKDFYNRVSELIKEYGIDGAKRYPYIIWDNPYYWINIVSKYVGWIKPVWTAEQQLSYVELRKKKFNSDGHPLEGLVYESMFCNNIPQIMNEV